MAGQSTHGKANRRDHAPARCSAQSGVSHFLRNMDADLVLPRVKLANAAVIDIEDDDPKRSVVGRARRVYRSHRTRPYAFRIEQLKGLVRLLEDEQDALCDALYKDLKKPRFEAMCQEIEYALRDAKEMVGNLRKWMRPERPTKTVANFFDKLYVYNDPYGVVLLIAPWNYPVQLLLVPLMGM